MQRQIEYKGFKTVPQFSFPDDAWYGKIDNIADLVTYETPEFDDIKNQFQEAVEEYLEECQRNGRDANLPTY
jgi:predicted HicB family RNase H-like nuclease